MNLTIPCRTLIADFILFLLFTGVIWAIHSIIMGVFPGNNLFPIFVRFTTSIGLLAILYHLNYRFCRKNLLNDEILKFKLRLVPHYCGGIILGCLLIATIWTILYFVNPFEIIKNNSTAHPALDIVSFSLGNTLEELLFRGFLLLAAVKLFGKTGGILLVSLLFGLFHLQGMGLTPQGLTMILTTSSMSLLFISVIYFTASIWTAVTLHITGNLLLHTAGFDGTGKGLFQIRFSASDPGGHSEPVIFIYEFIVLLFALVFFMKARKQL